MSDGIICAEQDCGDLAEIEVTRVGVDPKDNTEATIWLCELHYKKIFGKERLLMRMAADIEDTMKTAKAALPSKYRWARQQNLKGLKE